jgi:hypothetical protein
VVADNGNGLAYVLFFISCLFYILTTVFYYYITFYLCSRRLWWVMTTESRYMLFLLCVYLCTDYCFLLLY